MVLMLCNNCSLCKPSRNWKTLRIVVNGNRRFVTLHGLNWFNSKTIVVLKGCWLKWFWFSSSFDLDSKCFITITTLTFYVLKYIFQSGLWNGIIWPIVTMFCKSLKCRRPKVLNLDNLILKAKRYILICPIFFF